MTYFYQFQPAKRVLQHFLATKPFKIELGDVKMVEGNWNLSSRKKNFILFDIKRNKYLKSKGIQFSKYSDSQKQKIKIL